MLWTTFTPQQIDIDVTHPQGKAYILAILKRFAESGIRVAAGTPFLSIPGGQLIRVTVGQVRDDFSAVGAQLAAAAAGLALA